MELEESTFLTSDSTTKIHALRQHGTGTKSEREINQSHSPLQQKELNI